MRKRVGFCAGRVCYRLLCGGEQPVVFQVPHPPLWSPTLSACLQKSCWRFCPTWMPRPCCAQDVWTGAFITWPMTSKEKGNCLCCVLMEVLRTSKAVLTSFLKLKKINFKSIFRHTISDALHTCMILTKICISVLKKGWFFAWTEKAQPWCWCGHWSRWHLVCWPEAPAVSLEEHRLPTVQAAWAGPDWSCLGFQDGGSVLCWPASRSWVRKRERPFPLSWKLSFKNMSFWWNYSHIFFCSKG